jgi:hypothetical protein
MKPLSASTENLKRDNKLRAIEQFISLYLVNFQIVVRLS